MTKRFEIYKCPICGRDMIKIVDGSALNFKCNNCGYGEATTIAEGIEWDSKEYEINIIIGNDVTIEKIKALSKISSLNYFECKSILLQGGLLTKGRAIEIRDKIKMLEKNDINYSITPEYSYNK